MRGERQRRDDQRPDHPRHLLQTGEGGLVRLRLPKVRLNTQTGLTGIAIVGTKEYILVIEGPVPPIVVRRKHSPNISLTALSAVIQTDTRTGIVRH